MIDVTHPMYLRGTKHRVDRRSPGARPPASDREGRQQWMRQKHQREIEHPRGSEGSTVCGCGRRKQAGKLDCPTCMRENVAALSQNLKWTEIAIVRQAAQYGKRIAGGQQLSESEIGNARFVLGWTVRHVQFEKSRYPEVWKAWEAVTKGELIR